MRRFLSVLIVVLSFLVPYIPIASANSGPIIFLIDTSGSMRGERTQAVKEALGDVINNLRTDVRIGIYGFSTSVKEIVPVSLDRNLAIKGIESLDPKGKTSLFDSIEFVTSISVAEQPSRLVVFSDGGDTKSLLNVESLLLNLKDRGIPVDIIGLELNEETREELAQISLQTGGLFFPIESISDVITAYRGILSESLVSLEQDDTILDLRVERNLALERVLIAASVLVSFLLITLLISQYKANESKRSRFSTLQEYAPNSIKNTASQLRVFLSSELWVPKRIEKRIKERLELIDYLHRYSFFVRICSALWVLFTILLNTAIQNVFVSLILASILFPMAVKSFLSNRLDRKRRLFQYELPEMLSVVSSGLNAGLGLQQSLEAFAGDSQGEVARQLRRAIAEMKVGAPIDESLLSVAKRMESEELRWAVTALSIQRTVGGSLATILQTAYETIKSRSEIKREVRTLSAEGRLSAQVLVMLPIGIFLFLFLTRREYVEVLWSQPLGLLLMILIGTSMSLGWIWMKKVVTIKI